MDIFEADMTEQNCERRDVVPGDAGQDERGAARKMPFVDFLESVRMGDLDLTRARDTGREVDL